MGDVAIDTALLDVGQVGGGQPDVLLLLPSDVGHDLHSGKGRKTREFAFWDLDGFAARPFHPDCKTIFFFIFHSPSGLLFNFQDL